jgi:hypothetical protein
MELPEKKQQCVKKIDKKIKFERTNKKRFFGGKKISANV